MHACAYKISWYMYSYINNSLCHTVTPFNLRKANSLAYLKTAYQCSLQETIFVWAYGKAGGKKGNGNEMEMEMEIGNGNWKRKWKQNKKKNTNHWCNVFFMDS